MNNKKLAVMNRSFFCKRNLIDSTFRDIYNIFV